MELLKPRYKENYPTKNQYEDPPCAKEYLNIEYNVCADLLSLMIKDL
ncbi:MAG: hypothetical protein ACI9YE_002861 [Psychroserpens sp.]|jgi:hypothetical protein